MGKTDIKSNESFQMPLSATEKCQMVRRACDGNLTSPIRKDGDQGGLPAGGSDIYVGI